jgi:thiol-disulfide isomerase/thioredoxin
MAMPSSARPRARRRAAMLLAATFLLVAPGAAGAAQVRESSVGAPDSPARRPAGAATLAGMTLERKGDRIVVGSVATGSAAAAAGLRPGDALLEVNGLAVSDLDPLSLEAARALFKEDPAAGNRLVLGRGTETLGATLTIPAAGAPSEIRAAETPRVGGTAPDFRGAPLKGGEFRLESFRGRPVLIDFWASWCPPCREQTITLRRLAEEYKDGLVIIGVSLDENRAAFEAFAYNHNLPGFQVPDGGPDGPIGRLYAVGSSGIPHAVLVDAAGRIAAIGSSLHEQEEAIARAVVAARRPSGTS